MLHLRGFISLIIVFACPLLLAETEICPPKLKQAGIYNASQNDELGELISKAFQQWVRLPISDNPDFLIIEQIKKTVERDELFAQFLAAVAPQALSRGRFPGPIQFTRLHDQFLASKGIPKDRRVLPGVIAYKKAGRKKNYRAFNFLEDLPAGYVIDEKPSIYEFYRALNQNVFPIAWSDERVLKFNMLMFYHDLHHLVAFARPEFYEANRQLTEFILAKVDKGEIKINSYLLSNLGLQDFLEEMWFLSEDASSRINLVVDTQTAERWDAFAKRNLELNEIISHLKYSERRPDNWETLLNRAYAEKARNISEFKSLMAPLKTRFEEAVRIFETERVTYGAAIADGISILAYAYPKGGRYLDIFHSINIVLRTLFDDEYLNQYGIPRRQQQFEDIKRHLMKGLNTPDEMVRYYIDAIETTLKGPNQRLLLEED